MHYYQNTKQKEACYTLGITYIFEIVMCTYKILSAKSILFKETITNCLITIIGKALK